jgi:hypothetical protein
MSSRRFASIVIICVVFGACARAKKTFDTPEAAIAHFVKSMAAADVDAAMTAFAVDDVAARYDYPAIARYLSVVDPLSLYAPSHHEMYVRLNRIRLAAEAGNTMRVFAYGVLTDPVIGPPKQPSESEIAAFMAALDPARLKALKLVRVDAPMTAAARDPEFLANQKRHAGFNGADDQTERVALYELGGQHFWSGYQLLRYGKRWVISQGFSLLVSGPIASKTTPAEYEARLK